LTARPTLEQALQQDGVVNGEGLNKARAYSQSKGVPLERALTALSLADEERVWRSLSKASGLPFVDPGKAKVGDDLLAKVPPDQIEQNGALPVLVKNGVLYVAIDDPVKTFVADNLAFFAGCEVRCALAPPRALKDAIKRAVSGESQSSASGAAGRSAKAAGASSGTSGDPDAPILAFPPDGAELAADGTLPLRVEAGRGPFTWLADGAPIAVARRDRQIEVPAPGPGFVVLSVIDAEGRAARSHIRIDPHLADR
jgi:hypothetical protein